MMASSCAPMTILVIYRLGSEPPTATFCGEFITLLEQFALYNSQLVIAGDLNLHLEDPRLPVTVEFTTIIEQFGLMHMWLNLHISWVGSLAFKLPQMTAD